MSENNNNNNNNDKKKIEWWHIVFFIYVIIHIVTMVIGIIDVGNYCKYDNSALIMLALIFVPFFSIIYVLGLNKTLCPSKKRNRNIISN